MVERIDKAGELKCNGKSSIEKENIRTELVQNFDRIMDAIHDDLLIADGKGNVIKVSPDFEEVYGISREEAIGRSVYELEHEGYFSPSIVAQVIKKKQKVTMRQKTGSNRDIVVTATPIFDGDDVKFVVSFSRDITEMLELQKQYSKLEYEVEKYKAELEELRKGSFIAEGVVGESPQLENIMQLINRVSDFDTNILLLGPSGVGKTMFAKIIHQTSRRKEGPFIDINCAAIPDNLLESELFGYEKGSFTGASSNGKIGLIELANKGTLLLDEISEMPLRVQAKLLKAIQDKVITRVGGIEEISVDFRLIAASNSDLESFAKEGRFRKDLFYRINVVNINIPPLSERKEDILPICNYFLEKINQKYGIKRTLSSRAIEALLNYSWPGNVRELANVIERAAVTNTSGIIKKEELALKSVKEKRKTPVWDGEFSNLNQAVEQYEAEIVRGAYEKLGNSVEVGKALGISQATAYRKINRYIKAK